MTLNFHFGGMNNMIMVEAVLLYTHSHIYIHTRERDRQIESVNNYYFTC